MRIIYLGFPSVGSLLGRTINAQQMQALEGLKNVEKIILIHPDPENLILRISKIKFIRLFPVSNLIDLSKEKFYSYLNSPGE